ncbi:MAG: aldehyde dehydrogenase family protein [Deltaproteobacteria bacterium]|nr:aldehyde dehydrogenase family protein [Deltaproteobacteria bacterium]
MSATSPTTPRPGTINPVDGSPLEPVPWTPPDQIPVIVARARTAQAGWAALTLKERSAKMLEMARRVVEHREEAAALLSQEIGRQEGDNLLTEVSILVSYAKGAVAVAKKTLKPQRVRLSALEFPGKKVVVEAVPRGVVAIIEPWNYPLLQFYKALFPALLSGNAVVLKPSEHTPRAGRWLVEQCTAVLPEGLVGLIIGAGEAGAALVEADVDAVVFTGSTTTGRRVAARCAERLIPCSVELGGKDAAIVLADCNLDRTVAGVAYAALHNAGQDCAALELVYVEEAIAESFVERLAGMVRQLRVAPHPEDADLCPLQNAQQLDIVADHGRGHRHRLRFPAHGARGVHPGHEGGRRGDLRSRGRGDPGEGRRGGHPARQRLPLWSLRLRVDQGPRQGRGAGAAARRGHGLCEQPQVCRRHPHDPLDRRQGVGHRHRRERPQLPDLRALAHRDRG